MSKARQPEHNPDTIICCLYGLKDSWTAPPAGERCKSKAHGHITLGRVAQLVDEEKMEMVAGEQKDADGEPHPSWIPVARFVRPKRWKAKISGRGTGASMRVMQLVA